MYVCMYARNQPNTISYSVLVRQFEKKVVPFLLSEKSLFCVFPYIHFFWITVCFKIVSVLYILKSKLRDGKFPVFPYTCRNTLLG